MISERNLIRSGGSVRFQIVGALSAWRGPAHCYGEEEAKRAGELQESEAATGLGPSRSG